MNRSKFFLATTAGLLAVAGVFASKYHSFTASKNGYYLNTITQNCTKFAGNLYSTLSTAGSRATGISTQYKTGACATKPLYHAE